MRVLLDTTFAARAPRSGTAIYLQALQRSLTQLDAVEVVAVANLRRGPAGAGALSSVRNYLIDRWWSAVGLPRLAAQHGADVVHHPLPAKARLRGTPQVITVHDLAFERLPAHFDHAFRIYAHLTHRAAASAAGAVICVSESTAAEVRALWGVPGERIVVARHGPGQEPATVLAGQPRPAPAHFLYVGDDEPRKDLGTLLGAYRSYREASQAPLELVLAGSARASGAGIRIEANPNPQRLAHLYASAAALVHASLYEGFGLTALEAMSAGTPVLAARSPGTLEVCGDAARYADPGDQAGFAVAMAEIADSPAFREQLGGMGLVRAAEFSWDACARAHVEAYSLAVGR